MTPRIIFFLLVLLVEIPAFAAMDSASVSMQKQNSSDTTKSAVPHKPTDTIRLHSPLGNHGSLFMIPLSNITITKQELPYLNFTGLHDIISQKVPAFYPLHLGSYGQINSFSVFGGSLRDVTLRYDGRNMNSRSFGAVNLEQFPPEMIEKIEILTGTDAIVFSDNSNGSLINIQEIRHNIGKPFTRISFSQGGYNFIASDGTFSQNIAPNWNATLGFRRESASSRFTNSGFDVWNLRAILRWSPSDKTSFSLTELFTNHGIGTNGGLDSLSPSFSNELIALPMYPDLDERVFRHDITLSASTLLADDSSSTVSGAFYFSNAIWEKNRPRELAVAPDDTIRLSRFVERTVGATARLEQNINSLTTLRYGGEAEFTDGEQSRYTEQLKGIKLAGYGHLVLQPLSKDFTLRTGARIFYENTKLIPSFGAAGELKFSDNLAFSVDISQSSRAPSAAEGLGLMSERTLLGFATVQYKQDSLRIGATVFSRLTTDPILSEAVRDTSGLILASRSFNGDSRRTLGINTQANWQHGALRANGFFQLYQTSTNGTSDSRLPLFYAGISAQYEYQIGQSLVQGGLSVKFLGSMTGETFLPQTWTSIPSRTGESNTSFNGIDAFIVVRLGNAFVRATFFNIISQSYYYVPLYPQLDRNLRLSVSWSFLD
jgi:hypothetical protein